MQRMTSLEHFRAIAVGIGPRSSASEEETKAADYVAEQLTAYGLTPQKQHFLSAEYTYAPHMLYAGLGLLSLFLFWQTQPVGAAAAVLIMVTALISIALELQLRPNLLRWLLPIERSTNVIVDIPRADAPAEGDGAASAGVGGKKIIVTAHLDVHRKPAIFIALGGVKVLPALFLAGEIAGAVLIVLAAIGVPVSASILRQIALAPGLVFLALLVVMFLANRSPYEKGVGDNAGGLAVLLSVAERLKTTPLAHSEATFVFTGAEEAGCYGAQAYFASRQDMQHDTVHIVVDAVGARGTAPAIVRAERYVSTVASDAKLLAIADAIASAHAELSVTQLPQIAGRSELTLSASLLLPVIPVIGVTSVAKDVPPPAETIEPIEPIEPIDPDQSSLQRHESFLWELLQGIDASAAGDTAPASMAA